MYTVNIFKLEKLAAVITDGWYFRWRPHYLGKLQVVFHSKSRELFQPCMHSLSVHTVQVFVIGCQKVECHELSDETRVEGVTGTAWPCTYMEYEKGVETTYICRNDFWLSEYIHATNWGPQSSWIVTILDRTVEFFSEKEQQIRKAVCHW